MKVFFDANVYVAEALLGGAAEQMSFWLIGRAVVGLFTMLSGLIGEEGIW